MSEPGTIDEAKEILTANYRGHAKVRIGRSEQDESEWLEIHLPALSQARPPAEYMGFPVRVLNADTKEAFRAVDLMQMAAPVDPARAVAEQRARATAQKPPDPTPTEVPSLVLGDRGAQTSSTAKTAENPKPVAPTRREYIEAGYPAENYDSFLENLLAEGFSKPRQ